VEESRLFEKIYEYSREKTAIIVTHRMALAKLADRVLVMKNGKIVQDGTHEQLSPGLDLCRIKTQLHNDHL
jgi:ATP-binding cassette subfamily B protein